MLNASARNCSSLPSVIGKFLTTEKSTVMTPGPINVLRPRLPNVPSGCGANAQGSKYSVGVPTGVPAGNPRHPKETPLVGLVLAPARRFGRSAKLAPDNLFCDRLAEFSTVNGTPPAKVPMLPTLQPCTSCLATPCKLRPNGKG